MIGKDKINSITGATVFGKDGEKIGTVGQLYVDAHDGNPSWVSVKTGLFGHKESFIPLQDARADGDRLHVGYDKAMVKDAPRVDTDGALGPEDEDELYRYYGIGSPAAHDTDPDRFEGRDDRETLAEGDAVVSPVPSATDQNDLPSGRHRAGGELDRDGGGDIDGDDRVGTTGFVDDGSMVRSEEQVRVVGMERVPVARVRLRKYTVTTNEQVTVPVQKEEVRLETEPADTSDSSARDTVDRDGPLAGPSGASTAATGTSTDTSTGLRDDQGDLQR
ncbi:MAG TPA: PRC and DUF2382 domain-containing protein [Naasia sp.]|jgi:sporulation protein YlmC with PRC-barrel domain